MRSRTALLPVVLAGSCDSTRLRVDPAGVPVLRVAGSTGCVDPFGDGEGGRLERGVGLSVGM